MTSNHTSKYQLSQWEKSDKVLMEDFNGDNQKIEDALAGLDESKADRPALEALSELVTSAMPNIPGIHMGTYTGTGTYGAGNPTSVTFPFKPKLVVLMGDNASAVFIEGRRYGLAHVGDYSIYYTLTWDDATLSWYQSGGSRAGYNVPLDAGNQMNAANVTYHYFIIG